MNEGANSLEMSGILAPFEAARTANRRDRAAVARMLQGSDWRFFQSIKPNPEPDELGFDELAEINRRGMDVEQYSDAEIEARARELRARAGGSLESIRAAFFAVARDASRRVLGPRPFDVQVLAAIALDCGHVVEMQTGEGKTLAAD